MNDLPSNLDEFRDFYVLERTPEYTVDFNAIKESIDQILLDKETRLLEKTSSSFNYYFRMGEVEVESESGTKTKLKALYCDEYARMIHIRDQYFDLSQSLDLLNLILQNIDVVFLDDAVDFLEKYDQELLNFINQNYSLFPLKLKKLLFHDRGYLIRKQVPLYLALNGDSSIPYNQARVGANVKYIRTIRGWTQEKLVDESRVSLRTIRRVESGRKCNFQTIELLAKAFHVDISRLLW